MADVTVFLSSTQRDLEKHREAVYSAIARLDGFRCDRMENFGARDEASVDLCIRRVQQCDCFVALIGHYYGSCPEGEHRSYTEIEYDAAVECDKPILVGMAPETSLVPAHLVENNEAHAKQKLFRERVNRERQRAEFETADQAALAMVEALHNWLDAARRAPVELQEGALAIVPEVTQAPQIEDTSAMDTAAEQRAEALSLLASAVAKGDEDFKEKRSEALTTPHVARVFLAAKTLFGHRCSPENLSTRETNSLYLHRQDIEPGGWERSLLWRSLLADGDDLVPGWWWFRVTAPNTAQAKMWATAVYDEDNYAKAGALRLLTRAGSVPTQESPDFDQLLEKLADNKSPDVQIAFLEVTVHRFAGRSEGAG